MVKEIASGVRKGNVIEHEDGKLYVVLKAESMHPGKGTPTTTIDMRRISDGVKTVVRYKTTDPLERAFVETITHSYLYKDDDNYVFMNPENYENLTLTPELVEDVKEFLSENMVCEILFIEGKAVSVEPPSSVTLKVVESPEGVRGDSANNVMKVAKLETGLQIQVPLFIKEGELIKVDTREKKYMGRA